LEKMKIGILGGTFNPPHLGHLAIACDVKKALSLDKIFFIPTNIPPHKEVDLAKASDRIEMLKLMVEGNCSFEVLDIEIKRGEVSYTIDTVRSLRAIYPQDQFYLIVGSDLAQDFASWKEFERLKRLVEIVVAQRKQSVFSGGRSYTTVDIDEIDISSSKIRTMIRTKKPLDCFLHPNVVSYIKKHKLYLGL